MNRDEIIEEVMRLNPGTKREEYMWRLDGRLEWICSHGIGHTVYAPKAFTYNFVHGCDGCCAGIVILRRMGG